MQPAWLSRAAAADAAQFRALADPVRRAILQRLAAAPSSAGDLARALDLPRVNVTHHIGVLAQAGLVDQQRRRTAIRPQALAGLRRYFDLALTVAAIGGDAALSAVADVTQP